MEEKYIGLPELLQKLKSETTAIDERKEYLKNRYKTIREKKLCYGCKKVFSEKAYCPSCYKKVRGLR